MISQGLWPDPSFKVDQLLSRRFQLPPWLTEMKLSSSLLLIFVSHRSHSQAHGSVGCANTSRDVFASEVLCKDSMQRPTASFSLVDGDVVVQTGTEAGFNDQFHSSRSFF